MHGMLDSAELWLSHWNVLKLILCVPVVCLSLAGYNSAPPCQADCDAVEEGARGLVRVPCFHTLDDCTFEQRKQKQTPCQQPSLFL